MHPLECTVQFMIICKEIVLSVFVTGRVASALPSSPEMSSVSRKVPDVSKGSWVIAVNRERRSGRDTSLVSEDPKNRVRPDPVCILNQ